MRRCIYAKNTGRPCETGYSRQIECEAGEPNTCLRNCSTDCHGYEPLDQSAIAAKSAEILNIKAPIVYEPTPTTEAAIRQDSVPQKTTGTCGGCKGTGSVAYQNKTNSGAFK